MNNFSGHEEAGWNWEKMDLLEKVVGEYKKWIPVCIKLMGNRYDHFKPKTLQKTDHKDDLIIYDIFENSIFKILDPKNLKIQVFDKMVKMW